MPLYFYFIMAKILHFPQIKSTTMDKSDPSASSRTYSQYQLLSDLETIALHLSEPVQQFKKPEDYAFLRRPYLILTQKE